MTKRLLIVARRYADATLAARDLELERGQWRYVFRVQSVVGRRATSTAIWWLDRGRRLDVDTFNYLFLLQHEGAKMFEADEVDAVRAWLE